MTGESNSSTRSIAHPSRGNEAEAASSGVSIAVTCENLTKVFGDGETKVVALSEITVDIRAGEMTLLVGPSGCGKTTLISIIAGLLTPTSGDVTLFGTPQSQLRGRRLVQFRAQNVGFVFQQYNLLPSLTAAENVAVPLMIQGVARSVAISRAEEMLDRVNMSNRRSQLPTQLSGGQQQRVAIARALVHEPRLLVCDEPTAALDAHSGQTVMALIKNVVVEPDRAVIVVTHDHRIFNFGDRLIEMADGKVVSVSSQAEFAKHSAATQ
ncbi:MAG: ABC transporter ATP-binding protein [Planctomycetaceae bacterium]|nr:ABC transporter ATP-binding protein [Planctomycetaceae bacterium]